MTSVREQLQCPKNILRSLDKLIKQERSKKSEGKQHLRTLKQSSANLDELLNRCFNASLWSHRMKDDDTTRLITDFILEKNQRYFPAYLISSSLHEHKGDLRESFEALKIYLSFDGSDYSLIKRAADLANQLGEEQDEWQLLNHLVQVQPNDFQVINRLGALCFRHDKMDHAESLFAHAVKMGCQDPSLYNNYGAALEKNDKHEEAIVAFKAAIEIEPTNVEYHNNLTHALVDLSRYEEAKRSAKNALALAPENGAAHFNYGVILEEFGDARGAVDSYERSLELDENSKFAYQNLSYVCFRVGEYERGVEVGLLGLEKYPDHSKIGVNVAFNYFMLDEWEKGFEYYGHRMIRNRVIDIPAWAGEDLSGKKLLIWGEQGIGDYYMFAWYFPLLQKLGVKCAVETDARLIPLMEYNYPDFHFFPEESLDREALLAENFDFMTVLASLGMRFYPEVKAAYDAVVADYDNRYTPKDGFIQCLPATKETWQVKLNALGPRPKIGICWRSGFINASRARNCLKPEDMVEIFRGLPVDVINLQYGTREEELAILNGDPEFNFHHFEDIDLKDDQTQLAGLISAMDLLVSHSTAVHSLAGAMGVPVWNFILSHSERPEPDVHAFAGMFPSVKYIEGRGNYIQCVIPHVRGHLEKWLEEKSE